MRDTLALIEEFLSSSQATHIRCNASTALGALSSDPAADHRDRSKASMERLALIAVSDPSREVRDHAVDILRRAAAGNRAPEVVQAAVEKLNETTKPDVRRRVYSLLGQLRAEGITGAPSGLGASLRRLRMIASIKCLPDAEVKQSFQWRPIWLAAAGTLPGAFVLALLAFLFAAPLTSEVVPALLIFSPLVGAGLSLVATQQAIPIGLHYDRLAGGLMAIVRAVMWSVLPSFLLAAFMFSEAPSSARVFPVCLASALTLPIVLASVKLGSLLAHGITARPWIALGVHAASGTAVGLITTLALAWRYPSLTDETDWPEVIYLCWAILSPAIVGLAVAFADIESRSVPPRRGAGWARTSVVVLSGLVCAYLLIKPIGLRLMEPVPREDLSTVLAGRPMRPIETRFDRMLSTDSVQILVSDKGFPLHRLDANREPTVRSTGPEKGRNLVPVHRLSMGRVFWLLQPGRYLLRLTSASGTTDLTDLFPRLSNPTASSDYIRAISLTLNPLGAQEISRNPEVSPREADPNGTTVVVWKTNPKRLPLDVSFEVSLPRQDIYVSLSDPDPEGYTSRLLRVTLLDSQKRDVANRTDPPSFARRLSEPGKYNLVTDFSDSTYRYVPDFPTELILILGVDEATLQLLEAAIEGRSAR